MEEVEVSIWDSGGCEHQVTISGPSAGRKQVMTAGQDELLTFPTAHSFSIYPRQAMTPPPPSAVQVDGEPSSSW